jgi:hypothetical protein
MSGLQIQQNPLHIPHEKELSDEELLFLLAEQKWIDGFTCRKCGNTNYCKGKTAHARRCTKCKSEESATAHSVFHHCKIPLNEAFMLARIICCNPKTSSYEISRLFEKRQMTCWKFKTRMLECMDNTENSVKLKSLIQIHQLKTTL